MDFLKFFRKKSEETSSWTDLDSNFFNPILGYKPNEVVPNRNRKQVLQSYLGWTYASVSAISQSASGVKYKLLNSNGKEVLSHPILKILENPNPTQSFQDIVEMTMVFWLLLGEAFWYMPQNAIGSKTEIYLLRPDLVRINRDSQGNVLNYVFTSDGKQTTFQPTEILHLLFADPMNTGRGYSPFRAVEVSQSSWEYMQKMNEEYFFNSARVDGYLTSDQPIDQETAKRIRDSWEKKFGGISQSHKTAVLHSGLKYEKVKDNPKEADFLKSSEAVRDFILSVYRVPKIILGITEGEGLNNLKSAEYVFAKYVVFPKQQKLFEQINKKLLPRFGKVEGVYFEVENPTPEDEETKAKVLSEKKWFLTINEARASEGLNPLKDGDVLAENYSKTLENTAQNSAKTLEIEKTSKSLFAPKKERPTKMELEKTIKRKEDELENLINKNYFQKIENQFIQKALESFAEKNGLEFDKKGLEEFDPMVVLEFSDELRELAQKFFAESGEDFWNLQDKYFAESIEFQNSAISLAVFDLTNRFESNVAKTTFKDFYEILIKIRDSGGTLKDAENSAKQKFDEYYKNRSKTIARTETANLNSRISYERYKKAGLRKYEWVHLSVLNYREQHLELDGRIINMGEVVKGVDSLLRFPHDPLASPADTINCRCSMMPYFED